MPILTLNYLFHQIEIFAFTKIFSIMILIHPMVISSQHNGVAMEEQQPLPPAPSLGSTIVNVFTSPSDTFTGLHLTASKPSLWIIPLIVTILMVILSITIGFTNESLKSQRLDATRTVMEQRVTDGKMTQDQMDKMMEGMERGGGFILAIQIIAVIIIFSIMFFLSAFLLWLGSKFMLRLPVGYGKILELSGIATWIGALGVLLQIFMMVGLNSIYARPAFSIFFLNSFDPMNTVHKLLAMVDFLAIWQTIVIGIGLQKWSGKSLTLALTASFVVWLLVLGLTYLMGFAG
jgi:hypothetical protein